MSWADAGRIVLGIHSWVKKAVTDAVTSRPQTGTTSGSATGSSGGSSGSSSSQGATGRTSAARPSVPSARPRPRSRLQRSPSGAELRRYAQFMAALQARPSPLIPKLPTQSVVPGETYWERLTWLRDHGPLARLAPRGHELKPGDPSPPPKPERTLIDVVGRRRFAFDPKTSYGPRRPSQPLPSRAQMRRNAAYIAKLQPSASPLIPVFPTQSVVPGENYIERMWWLQHHSPMARLVPRGHQLKPGGPQPPPREPGRTLIDMFGPRRFSFGPNTSYPNPMRQVAEGVADLVSGGPYHRWGDGDNFGIKRIAYVVSRLGSVAAVGKALGVTPPQFLLKATKPFDLGVVAANFINAASADNEYSEGRISYAELQSARASALLSLGFWLPAGKAAKLADAAGLGKDYFDEMKAAQEGMNAAQERLKQDAATRAGGGRVRHGETTLVGERGPELVRLPAGLDAIAARRTRALLEAAAGRDDVQPAELELHIHQHLDGREVALSTVHNLDDEQWGRP